MTDTEQSSRPDSRSGGGALLYAEASATLSESSYGHHHHNPQPTSTESYQVVEDSSSLYMKMERPDQAAVSEIVGLLKVRNSMLAQGACERVKKLSKAYPAEIVASPILDELVKILEDGPGTPLALGAMAAMSSLALLPEGRQKIVLLGGATPLIKLIMRCDLNRPNTTRAVQLLMNLGADSQNRRIIRESGGIEALVALMRAAPLEAVLEHAMGALHNVMLTDSKAKLRAVDAGVTFPLARILAARLPDSNLLLVRANMLLSDLLRIENMQELLIRAAQEQGLRLPGMMGPGGASLVRRPTDANGSPLNTSDARRQQLSPSHDQHDGGISEGDESDEEADSLAGELAGLKA